jgi:hypothetical protein
VVAVERELVRPERNRNENGRKKKRKNGRTEERKNGRTEERKNGRTEERKNGRTEERKNGRTEEEENGKGRKKRKKSLWRFGALVFDLPRLLRRFGVQPALCAETDNAASQAASITLALRCYAGGG